MFEMETRLNIRGTEIVEASMGICLNEQTGEITLSLLTFNDARKLWLKMGIAEALQIANSIRSACGVGQ